MLEAGVSLDTSVHLWTARCCVQEDSNLHSPCCRNLNADNHYS